jgi:hypothetical protein
MRIFYASVTQNLKEPMKGNYKGGENRGYSFFMAELLC